MNLTELLAEKDRLNVKICALMEPVNLAQGELSTIESQISAAIEESIKQARLMAGKDTGTVDVLVQGVMVKSTVSKVVKWHQDKMEIIRLPIRQHNDDPDQYMKPRSNTRLTRRLTRAFPSRSRRCLQRLEKSSQVLQKSPLTPTGGDYVFHSRFNRPGKRHLAAAEDPALLGAGSRKEHVRQHI